MKIHWQLPLPTSYTGSPTHLGMVQYRGIHSIDVVSSRSEGQQRRAMWLTRLSPPGCWRGTQEYISIFQRIPTHRIFTIIAWVRARETRNILYMEWHVTQRTDIKTPWCCGRCISHHTGLQWTQWNNNNLLEVSWCSISRLVQGSIDSITTSRTSAPYVHMFRNYCTNAVIWLTTVLNCRRETLG